MNTHQMGQSPRAGYGFVCRHVFLVLDGSGSMKDIELASGQPKHLQVARMSQCLVDELHKPAFDDTFISIYTYDATVVNRDQYTLRCSERLSGKDSQSDAHVGNTDLSLWDSLQGHGWATPIGDALAYVYEKAADWIDLGDGSEQRRAVIYLLSDGMNNVGDDGKAVRDRIDSFNQESRKGRIRLATIGYYQRHEGDDDEEDAGRVLLKELPNNTHAYFESGDTEKILNYILSTLSVFG